MNATLNPLDIDKISLQQESSLNYLDWNDQIAQHFFHSNNSGRRVWFSVEKELIEEICRKNNTTFSDFIEVVKKGPDGINRHKQTVCSKAHAIFDEWKKNESKFKYPPYVAYLALFVLAVNHGESGDFSENDYYGRLNNLVGENLSTSHFKSIPDLWEDLEKWSLHTQRGDLGEFHLGITGRKFYIGILQYQVALTKEERIKSLPRIFSKMGWDSNSNPTAEEILQATKEYKSIFSNRTKRRIEAKEEAFLADLVNRVLEELEDYDGELLETREGTKNKNLGYIDLCMSNIDQLEQKVTFSFRCRRKAGLPDEEFVLRNNTFQWRVPPSSFNLSGQIEKFDINWSENFSAETKLLNFSYRGQKYKIFTPGEKFGIFGWISGQRYTPNKLFYLAVQKQLSDKVKKWGEEECNEFHKMDIIGLPDGWELFEIEGVHGDSLIKKDIPALSIDVKPRIKLEGGIRISKGNKFFSFIPPHLSFIGGVEKEFNLVYSIEGEEEKHPLIQSNENNRSFFLSKDVPIGKWVSISVQISSENSKSSKTKFMLVENRLRKICDYSNGRKINCFGNFKKISKNSSIEESYLVGAFGYKLENVKNYQRLPQFSLKKKTYFIGKMPGQIVDWSKEGLPDSWIPFWAIQFKTYKKATAILLRDQDDKHNSQDIWNEEFPKDKVKLWKKIIWNNRKRITPELKSKNKWIQFTKRIENV